MRCNKFQDWSIQNKNGSMTEDMLEHIKNCSDCSVNYKGDTQLDALFSSHKDKVQDEVTPLYQQKLKIEEKLGKRLIFILPARKYPRSP